MRSNSIPEAKRMKDRCMYCGRSVALKDLKDGELVCTLYRKSDPKKRGRGKLIGQACQECSDKDSGVHTRKQ